MDYINTIAAFIAESILITGPICILLLIAQWKIFTKAGRPGWASIVPIYNIIVMIKVAKKPSWWLLFFFIPPVNIIFLIKTIHAISENFGHSGAFTLGLLLLPTIFLPILAFEKNRYRPFR